MDYINKEYYNSIEKRNRRFINSSEAKSEQFIAALERENIPFSAAISAYKTTFTVSAEYYERAKNIHDKIPTPVQTRQNEIIGNTDYRSIRSKNYISTDEHTARELSKLLAGNSDIRFSGVIRSDGSAVITADGEKNAANIRRMIDNIENSELYEALKNMGFSRAADSKNGFINIVNDKTGETVGFENADSLRAAITDGAYNSFFHPENFGSENKEEIAENIPNEDHFILRQDQTAVDWIYYNPDGNSGEGQFVETTLYADDMLRAYNARINAETPEQGREAFLNSITDNHREERLIDSGTELFTEYVNDFLDFKESDSAIISKGVPSDDVIARLENNFPEVQKDKTPLENSPAGNSDVIGSDSDNIEIEGYTGTWYVIDEETINGQELYLLESEIYGDEAAGLIVDRNKNVIMDEVYNGFEDYRENTELSYSEQLIELTDKITKKQAEFTEFISAGNYDMASSAAAELAEMSRRAEEIKAEIQKEAITVDDVQTLRSIEPKRKSVQNMLENEVAQTPKFEKLLGEELGEKSAYAMRNSDNEWRNDESKRAVVVEVQKRDIPENLAKLRKAADIPRGTFVNRDTGIEIIFGKRSIDEIIAKAIQEDKRGVPIDARIAVMYQMQHLVENSIDFDSQISEYDAGSSKNKSPNTLFMHKMYGVVKYETEYYLTNLSVEEFYSVDKENRFNNTTNRLYNLRDIKITPIEANRIFSPAVPNNNVGEDTSTSVTTITIPQLYDIVKTFDQNFFENPNAEGRSARESEIQAQEEYHNAVEKFNEHKNELSTRVNDEYRNFINGLKMETPDVLVESAAEIVDKERIQLYLEENTLDLTDEQYEALLSRPNPLDEIYEQWVKNGELNSLEDVGIALKETADRILISLERENIRPEFTQESAKEKLTRNSKDVSFDEAEGTWHVVDYAEIGGKKLFLLESDNYGYTNEVGHIIADENENIVAENIHNGFAEYEMKNKEAEKTQPAADITTNEAVPDVIEEEIDETKDIDDTDNIKEALDLDNNTITFSVVTIEGEKPLVIGSYIDEEDITALEEYQDYIYDTGRKNIDVTVDYYTIGIGDNESYGADTDEKDYISEHLDEVLKSKYTDRLESETYFIATPAELLEEISGEAEEKNYLFTVVEFEDGNRYILPGEIGDNNIKDTEAWKEVKQNNFDIDSIADLDEDIRVTYTVYQTGSGEAVIPTSDEISKIKDNIDEVLSNAALIRSNDSSVRPWTDVDDIIYGMEEVWTERHAKEMNVSDGFDNSNFLFPENLTRIAHDSNGKDHYNLDDSIVQIKLSGSAWLHPVDAAVEMNRRGVNIDDIEMLNVRYVSSDGTVGEKDLTPEQYMVYRAHNEERPTAFLAAVNAVENRTKIPEEMMNIIYNDMPSFVKSAVAWDELMEYDGISERLEKGEDPVEVAKPYLANNGRFSWASEELKDGYFTWSAKDKGDTAEISVDVIDNDTYREKYKSSFEVSWNDIADAFKKRIEQENNYNKLYDKTITVAAVGDDKYRFVDKTDNTDVIKNRAELEELFAELFNKEELDGIIKSVIENAPYEKQDISAANSIENETSKPEQTDIVHNAFLKLKDNHDFSPEAEKFLDRVEKNISINHKENFDPQIINSPLFRTNYGSVSRIDSSLFEGNLKAVIDEVNGYIADNSPQGNSEPAYTNVFEWKEIHESIDEDTGKPTLWSTEISSENYGKFIWISMKDEHSFDIEYAYGDKFLPVSEDSTGFYSMADAAEWAENNLSDIISAPEKEQEKAEQADELSDPIHEKNLEAIQNIEIGDEITLHGETFIISSINDSFMMSMDKKSPDVSGMDTISRQFMGNWKNQLADEAGNEPIVVVKANAVKDNENTVSSENSTYTIYQIPSGDRYRDIRFLDYEKLGLMGQLPDRLNYTEVYTGKLNDIKEENKLDGIFVKFNMQRPDDFEGRSLSVSDVVVIENEESKKAYFVDDIGYKDITDIFIDLDRKEQTAEKLNIYDYNNIRLVSRSEWNDRTLGDDENPAFEEIAVSCTPNEDGSFTKYAYNTTNSNSVNVWEEENSISADEMLEDIANHLKNMEQDNGNRSYHIELTDRDGNVRTLDNSNLEFYQDKSSFALDRAKNYIEKFLDLEYSSTADFSDMQHISIGYTEIGSEEQGDHSLQMEADLVNYAVNYYIDDELAKTEKYDTLEQMNRDHLSVLSFEDMLHVGTTELDRILEEKNELESSGTEKRKSGSEIEVGDKFLYNDREYTVTDEKGIYPDDVGVSYEEKTGSISYVTKQNIDRNKLANEGQYLGNPIKEQQKENSPKGNPKAEKEKSSEKSFSEQVDEVLNGTARRYKSDLMVCNTPEILLKAGCRQLPMMYTRKHLLDAVHNKSKKNPHFHGIAPDLIKRIPELIQSPVMVFDSISEKNSDSIVMVLDAFDNDKNPLIMSVKPNGQGVYELKQIEANFITSIYGKDRNFAKYIERVTESNSMIFWDKNKSQELFRVLQLQLPQGVNNLDSNVIIHQSRNIVNTQNEISSQKTVTEPQPDNSPQGNSEYDPKVNDIIEYQEQLYRISDITGENITLEEADNLIPKTRFISLSSLLGSDFTVIEESNETAAEKPAEKITEQPQATEPEKVITDVDRLAEHFTEHHEGKFLVEEYYETHRPTIKDLASYVKDLIENERKGFGLSGYTLNNNGITLVEQHDNGTNYLVDYTWEQVAEAISKAIESGKYITSEDIDSSIGDFTKNEELHKAEQPTKTEATKNFVITDENFGVSGGAKARYENNIAAIKTLKAIEADNRTATPEEQQILSKYTGWGAIPQAFDISNDKWSKEYTELKELLTPDEYKAARESTMNAHYTSPTVISAIYDGLKNLGFESGKILEPAMGIGNFFGTMPESMRDSELHGVELDSLTGRIAQQLYPNAEIKIKGYENTYFPDNSFDVAVGNVPFGSYKLNDDRYNENKFLIHDYFFAKTLDKVRPGGVIAFVTSKGTMDKENSDVRKYIAERAELLGAIRLPNNAFEANAGTEVTSDIIFLQKRESPIEIDPDKVEWLNKAETPNGLSINNYFVQHPEMVLGEIVEGNKLYGRQTNDTTCIPIEGADLKQQLAEAVQNIKGTYTARREADKTEKTTDIDIIEAPENMPKYSYAVVDNKLYFHESGPEMHAVKANKDRIERASAMIELRTVVKKLLDLQSENINGKNDHDISDKRKELNTLYDSFTEKYGNISDKKNAQVLKGDAGYTLVSELELKDEQGNVTGKADIFTKNTVRPNTVITHADSPEEALIISVAEKGKVDFDYMTEITGMSKESLISALTETGQIYRLPQSEEKYVTADEYLTGNIRIKLEQARNAPEGYDYSRNIAALESAMPKPLGPQDITAKLGSHWIDPEYIRQFILEKIQPPFYSIGSVQVEYSSVAGVWKVSADASAKNSRGATKIYGTNRMHAFEIIDKILNNGTLQVKDRKTDENGDYIRDQNDNYVLVVNEEETKAVKVAADKIKSDFQDWIFQDPERRDILVQKYNDMYNSIRQREYDGSHLSFAGMNPAIELKEHQKNAVARALYGGNTLLAHAVGAGKTFEMIAIAMEGKRLGLHNKALIAVPNALTEQEGADFRKLYPNAKVLVATEKDFEKKNRQKLFSKIANNDWDAVIVGHSQFDRIGISKDREVSYINKELDDMREALAKAKQNTVNPKQSFSVKAIERTIKSYETRLQSILDAQEKEDFIDFEELGCDKLFIDESHMYKNLATATKMSNIAGVSTNGSQRAAQLLMKCKYLDELTDHKGVIFASGTPISNSMTEMYTLMRYLQSDVLEDAGIKHFDEWAADFGEIKTDFELKPESDGKYQMKTRFAHFTNVPELMNMFKECADIRTADTLNLEGKPNAHVHDIVAQPSKAQKKFVKNLGKRAEKIRSGNVDPRKDNMLCITNDGRKIGLDERLIDPNLPDNPGSKVNLCVQNVLDIYNKTSEQRSTQCIFCDMSTPKSEARQDKFIVYRPSAENESGFEIARKKVGLGKINDFDNIKTYINKNSSEEADKLHEGDIVVIRRPDENMENILSEAAVYKDGKLIPGGEELLNRVTLSSIEPMPPKEFNVYDDIKDKLIAQGVPEKEIAFIHDYQTSEEKQQLFKQMNSGDVRILLGSTQKCGAGMNAQRRMIALHHLDAPLRPSDMQQRDGRIDRQGNENKDVDIYRYVTDKTFDAYLYQILENKQKFISQVMTSKTPERVCSDIDEQALDYAEVKSLCAGNPLIKEQMLLTAEIRDLKMEKGRFNEQIYDMQDKIRTVYPNKIKENNIILKRHRTDYELAQNAEKIVTEDGKTVYPITVCGQTYTDKKEGGAALAAAAKENVSKLIDGKTIEVGEYRGMKISIFYDSMMNKTKCDLCGEKHHYLDLNPDTDIGNVIRLDNCIANIEKMCRDLENENNVLKSDLENMKVDVTKPFPKAEQLAAAEKRLTVVLDELTRFTLTDNSAAKDLYERLCDSFPDIMNGNDEHECYTAGECFDPLIVEKHGDRLYMAHTHIQNGDVMNDPLIVFQIKDEAAVPICFENSGMGIYEEHTTDEMTESAASWRSDVLDFADEWLDNIDRQGYSKDGPDEQAEKKNNSPSYDR